MRYGFLSSSTRDPAIIHLQFVMHLLHCISRATPGGALDPWSHFAEENSKVRDVPEVTTAKMSGTNPGLWTPRPMLFLPH